MSKKRQQPSPPASPRIFFSEGTYQIEIDDPTQKTSYWTFLQLNDRGDILDQFCNCSEAKQICPHLEQAYLAICPGNRPALHVRFRYSFWNLLCQIACRRQGTNPSALTVNGAKYSASSVSGKSLFSVEGLTPNAKKEVKALLEKREETEETSLKFSNLSAEALQSWKAGHPTPELQYELSFWSDLAKWLMSLQEEGSDYQIKFVAKEGKLPHEVEILFSQLRLYFYIAEVNWPVLIPSLSNVNSPLKAYEFQEYALQEIRYDKNNRCLRIKKTPLSVLPHPSFPQQTGIEVGDWFYVPQHGFFPKHLDQVFAQDTIAAEQVGTVLARYCTLMQKYMVDTPLHIQGIQVRHELFFDKEHALHIRCYVFEPGDLQHPDSVYFGPWVHLTDKGFYRLEEEMFSGIEKVIPREQMADFIHRHRVWLNGFEGFQTHVYRLESQLHFTVSKQGILKLDTILDMTDSIEGMIDLGEWIYLSGRGFFAKQVGKGSGTIRPPLTLSRERVPNFIRLHRAELETVSGFFSSRSPLEKAGLNITFNAAGKIVVTPQWDVATTYQDKEIIRFEDYTYVPGEGFHEIPHDCQLPPAYSKEKEIATDQESYFVLYELETLRPYLFSVDPSLYKPHSLRLNILKLSEERTENGRQELLLEAQFETEKGSIPLFDLWKALQEQKPYLLTQAGCILLKQPHLAWLKTLSRRQWLKKGKQLRLTTLQWLRLNAFEGPQATVATTQTRQLLKALEHCQTEQEINISGLKSQLRPYQEAGLRWLWFLYVHGLSGLLCDEMGLGKTHQAMGLITALRNTPSLENAPQHILVVCPTSVIYHWQTLFQRFLPDQPVQFFYGLDRDLSGIDQACTVILTSYGTLRAEIGVLSQIDFKLAVFDELQIAKNNRSQTHKALRKINALMRLGLSGTPIENRLLELKALFDVVLPGYMPQENNFRELFVYPIEKHQDSTKKALLSRLVKPFILRRKKTEVLLELPEKIEEIAYCDLSQEQHHLYTEAYSQSREALVAELKDESRPVPYVHIFSLLTTLKRICNHPCLVTKQLAHFQHHHSGKWDLFVELLSEVRASNQKVVIFSQYLEMLDLIQIYLQEQQIGYAGIRGSTRDRKAQLERFANDPQCEVFVASLQAAGVGIDLVAASVVIHYDRWWNPARENQATDRVHRMGQNRGVQVFKLVTKGTIEEHIHTLIERKKTLMEGVIGFDDHDAIKGLDRHELIELLSQM